MSGINVKNGTVKPAKVEHAVQDNFLGSEIFRNYTKSMQATVDEMKQQINGHEDAISDLDRVEMMMGERIASLTKSLESTDKQVLDICKSIHRLTILQAVVAAVAIAAFLLPFFY